MNGLSAMLIRMYSMSVWDNQGRQYLPVFDYEWRDIMGYTRADEAIITNTQAWVTDHTEELS